MRNAVFRTVLRIRIRIFFRRPDADFHQSEKQDPDPLSQKQEPDPHQSQKQNSGAVKAQNRAMEGRARSQWRRGGLKWSRRESVDQ
jgi:hypothetical protein